MLPAASASYNPMMMATMAAMAVGGMAFMSSAATVAQMKGGVAPLRVDDKDDETARGERQRTGARQARSMAAAAHEEGADPDSNVLAWAHSLYRDCNQVKALGIHIETLGNRDGKDHELRSFYK